MAKRNGRLMLIRIHDGVTALPNGFEVLCGLTAKTLTINNEEIDVTSADCDNPGNKLWTEVLNGVSRVSVSGSGFSKKDNAEAVLASIAMSTVPEARLRIFVPNIGVFEAQFFVSSSEFGGEQSGGVTFSLTAGSTGSVTFTPEA